MTQTHTQTRPAHAVDAVIVGLGQTGLSCARYLARQGLRLALTDSRPAPPLLPEFEAQFAGLPRQLGGIDPDLLLGAAAIVLSPGVPLAEPAVGRALAAGRPVYGDIELFCRAARAPVIAITGSNGKSTVTTLVGELLRAAGYHAAVGGNLGPPALDLLPPAAGAEPDVYVLELSSFQLETTSSLNARASAVLNISPDHMDRYDTLAGYAAAKRNILAGDGLIVLNKDDALVRAMAEQGRETLCFSLARPAPGEFGVTDFAGQDWLCFGSQKIIRQAELGIKGRHNTANALAALALTHPFAIPPDTLAGALRAFRGLAHRCQWVARINGVDWYNDSKATNVGACVAAIEGLRGQGRIILIAGGDSKGAELGGLAAVVKQYVRHVILLGRDAKRLASVLPETLPVDFASDLAEAVALAHAIARAGELVLLAPACASLDMFADYRARGAAFVQAVKALEAA